MDEVIGAVLTFFFFYKRFHTHKKHKTHINEQKQKRQHFYEHNACSLICVFVIFMLFMCVKFSPKKKQRSLKLSKRTKT